MFAINLLNGEIFVRLCVWVEKPLRQKRQSLAYPRTHERAHPIGHPVLGSYPSSALLPLSPRERFPLAHRGKQCLANQPQDHAARCASG